MRAALLLGCVALVLTGCGVAAPGRPQSPRPPVPPARHLLLLHLNDVADLDGGPEGGGLARAAAVVRRARAGVSRSLVTGGGDLLGPSAAALLLGGTPAAEGWRTLGLDVATPGDRDLALGPAALRRAIAESGARWTSANLGGGERPERRCCGTEDAVVLDLEGVRVGVAGVIGEDTAGGEARRWGIAVSDPVAAARRAVERLRAAGAEVVVLLAHGEGPLLELLARAARPDLVLGGHEGAPLALEAGPALVVRTGRGGRDVARIDLLVARGAGVVGRTLRFLPVGPEVAPDPALQGLAEAAAGRVEAAAAVPAGATAVALDPRPETLGAGEAPLGDLLADLARARLGADVALIDAGSVAGGPPLEPGPLASGLPLRLLPDLGPLAAVELSGGELLATLEHGLARLPAAAPRFLQLSGLTVAYDPERAPGRRVVAVAVDGTPLDAARHYRVATTARLARGADGHAWLRGARRLVPEDAGPLLAELLLDRMRDGTPLAPRADGRLGAVP